MSQPEDILDWFAGQVVAPLIVKEPSATPEAIAELAYEIAEAMVVEKIARDARRQGLS